MMPNADALGRHLWTVRGREMERPNGRSPAGRVRHDAAPKFHPARCRRDGAPAPGGCGRPPASPARRVPGPLQAQLAAARSDGPAWPGPLKGRHRQLVDAYAVNDGAPLAFAYTFLSTNEPPSASLVSATAVVVLRHGAFPIALGSEMWRKYRIGESFKIIDPETKAPAVKNPFLHPKAGVLPLDGMAI